MILPPFSLVRRRIFDILNLLPLISSCLEFVQSQENAQKWAVVLFTRVSARKLVELVYS